MLVISEAKGNLLQKVKVKELVLFLNSVKDVEVVEDQQKEGWEEGVKEEEIGVLWRFLKKMKTMTMMMKKMLNIMIYR